MALAATTEYKSTYLRLLAKKKKKKITFEEILKSSFDTGSFLIVAT